MSLPRTTALIAFLVICISGMSSPMRTNAQVRPYRVTDRQVEVLLKKIESESDRFKTMVDRDLDRGPLDGTRYEDGVMQYIGAFESATDSLYAAFRNRRSTLVDAREVLGRAAVINGFVSRNQLSPATRNQWNVLRRNLDTLARYYRTNASWTDPGYPQRDLYILTGTYRLDRSRSDDVPKVIDRLLAGRNITSAQRERYRQQLIERLAAPDYYAIEQSALRFTVGSSLSVPVSFTADGVARSEKSPRGRNAILTTRHSDLDGLSISFTGDPDYEYRSSFVRQPDGMLRVLRSVPLPDRSATVSVAWVYSRVADAADWSYGPRSGAYGDEVRREDVAQGERLSAVLSTAVSTKTSREGDRVELEVSDPAEHRGAVIVGRITQSEHSGMLSGNARLAFAFEEIRFRNNRYAPFDGFVTSVETPSGKRISISDQGSVKEDSQTKTTVVRAGVGAAIGAIIGAISGGKKGAAIGAVVGAGVGVGSVLLEGRDEIDLPAGTRFAITSRSGLSDVR